MRVYMFICGFVCMEKLIICGREKIPYLSQYEFESCIPLYAKNSNLHYVIDFLHFSIHLSISKLNLLDTKSYNLLHGVYQLCYCTFDTNPVGIDLSQTFAF